MAEHRGPPLVGDLERWELAELGVADVHLTEYGAVLATIPATTLTDAPTIALLAHVDTTPQFNGTGVRPIIHRDWQGGDIVLPDDPQMVLRPAELPYLATKVGQDIVTALLQGGPKSQAAAKDLIRAVADRPVGDDLVEDTARRIASLRATPEAKEGLAAFLDKRPAAWVPN